MPADIGIPSESRCFPICFSVPLRCRLSAIVYHVPSGYHSTRTDVLFLPTRPPLASFNGFIMQICCLIIAPAFLAAGDYILLGRLMKILGQEYSWIHPTSYAIVAITGDIISLVVQAAGGGLASGADTREGQDNGAYIMVGGVFWQVGE